MTEREKASKEAEKEKTDKPKEPVRRPETGKSFRNRGIEKRG